MELIHIEHDGSPQRAIENLPAIACEAMTATAALYRQTGAQAPWIGYLAIEAGECVGTCAFKSAPAGGRVEIAYFTFPANEGRGVASRMAGSLIEIARRTVPGIRVFAQTLPEPNASTRVLEKHGFQWVGEIDHPEDGKIWEWELLAAR
jgi:RimJ/RimL family protein N-acetyltransferase